MINPILGIDVWQGQLETDEAILKANDVVFMFIRLNSISGGHHKDIEFDRQWSEAVNFCRAPYFVYNPWVSGSANFLWLQDNMPHDAKAVGIDIEVIYPAYPPQAYAVEVAKFEALVKQKWNYVIYTGEWFLPYLSKWNPLADYWWAAYLAQFYIAQTLTWDELRTKLIPYTVPANANKIPGRLRFWQFSGDKLTLPGNAHPMDVNVYYGTLQNLYDWMGAPASAETPPSPDTIQPPPYGGITWITGQRYGYNFDLFKIDPLKVDFEVTCGELETMSSVAFRKGAKLAVTAGEWNDNDKNAPNYLLPTDLTVVNGQTCIVRNKLAARPSLVIARDYPVTIANREIPGTTQAFTGLRYLMQGGVIDTRLYDNATEHTEGHARSIHCLDAHGNYIVLISEGVYPNQGLLLWQGTELVQSYGAVTAFDGGGGGDVEGVLNDKVITVTENIDPSGKHFERVLPSVLLIFPHENGAGTMNGTAREALGNVTTVRKTPSRYGVSVYSLPANGTTEFVKDVPVVMGGSSDNPSDMWLELPDGNFINHILSGKTYYTILTQPSTQPPPTTTDEIVTNEINLTAKTVTTTVPEGWTGTTK